LKNKTSIIR